MRQLHRQPLVALLCGVVLMGVAACGGGSSKPYAGEAGVTKDSISIGWIYPRSGPAAAATANIEPAIVAAFNEVNDNGGIHGRKLVAKFGDDGYPADPSVALSSAKALSKSTFGVTTGGIFSDFGATYEYLAKAGVPHLFYNADRETALGLRNGFTTTTFVQTQAELLPQFMIAKFAAQNKKIGILHQDSPDTRPAVKSFEAKAKEAGLNVVISQPIEAVPTSCLNEVQKLRSAGAEVIWLAVGVIAVPCVLKDAKAIGYHPTWTGTGNFWTANVVNKLAGCLTEGMVAMASIHPIDTPSGQHYKEIVTKYFPSNTKAGEDDIAYLLYGMAHTWAEGLRRAGENPTRESLIKGMESLRDWSHDLYAPLTFGPKERMGGSGVLTVQAVNCRWKEIDSTWRTSF